MNSQGTRWPSGTRLDFAIARSRIRLPPVAAVYQCLRGRLMSSSLRGEGLVRLIGAVVCLLCCTAGPLVRYRGHWMAAYRATVSSAHANQLQHHCETVLFGLTTCKQRYIKYPGFFLPFYNPPLTRRTLRWTMHHQITVKLPPTTGLK